jgi:predicted nucleic acid-binding protein
MNYMTDRVFIDSNVWIYAFKGDDPKRSEIALNYILTATDRLKPVISSQVINETCNVLKKAGKPEHELREIIKLMFSSCEFSEFTAETANIASQLRETMSVSFWDSHIIAAAVASNCAELITEDMQTGAIIQGLRIVNIFS